MNRRSPGRVRRDATGVTIEIYLTAIYNKSDWREVYEKMYNFYATKENTYFKKCFTRTIDMIYDVMELTMDLDVEDIPDFLFYQLYTREVFNDELREFKCIYTGE